MNSFAHYSFGAVYQWMVENVAGIRNDAPAYKKIVIAPTPGGGFPVQFVVSSVSDHRALAGAGLHVLQGGLAQAAESSSVTDFIALLQRQPSYAPYVTGLDVAGGGAAWPADPSNPMAARSMRSVSARTAAEGRTSRASPPRRRCGGYRTVHHRHAGDRRHRLLQQLQLLAEPVEREHLLDEQGGADDEGPGDEGRLHPETVLERAQGEEGAQP